MLMIITTRDNLCARAGHGTLGDGGRVWRRGTSEVQYCSNRSSRGAAVAVVAGAVAVVIGVLVGGGG
jgi:hypothetical protein